MDVHLVSLRTAAQRTRYENSVGLHAPKREAALILHKAGVECNVQEGAVGVAPADTVGDLFGGALNVRRV